MNWVPIVLLSFLCGSIPFSVWLGKIFLGLDVRHYGDGNPGAMNAFRSGGKVFGLFSLILDISKAAAPVGIAYNILGIRGIPMFLIAIAPLLGHAFSPFLRFRGGKALAVSLGVWIGLTIWKASLAGVIGVLVGISLTSAPGWAVMLGLFGILTVLLLCMPDPLLKGVWIGETIILVWTHRTDLRRRPRWRSWIEKFIHGLKHEAGMVNYVTHDLIIHFIIFQSAILLVILSNIFLLHRGRKHSPPHDLPLVSILVPARNEETNIRRCIQSLLTQDYPSFEVIVFDDESEDGTPKILNELVRTHRGLKIMTGSSGADGQGGKNRSCARLAQQAQGEYLFFTDADTVHQPQTLRLIVTAMTGEQADLLTGFPHQEMGTWGERLLVPFFSWASLCFNPLWLAYRLRLPWLSSAVGQMMLFRREAYQSIGGHASLGSGIIDDLTLARKIKAAGLRWRMVNITDLINCRMYHGGQEAVNGFTKNLFAAFEFRLLPFLFVFIWLFVLFWDPLITLAFWTLGKAPTAQLLDMILCIGLSLVLWFIPFLELGVPFRLGLLYPVTILANEAVAFRSLFLSLAGRLSWKGRILDQPNWKWL